MVRYLNGNRTRNLSGEVEEVDRQRDGEGYHRTEAVREILPSFHYLQKLPKTERGRR